MDNTDFDYINITNELEMVSDSLSSKTAEESVKFVEEEDVEFECDYDCDGCWFDPESCGRKDTHKNLNGDTND